MGYAAAGIGMGAVAFAGYWVRPPDSIRRIRRSRTPRKSLQTSMMVLQQPISWSQLVCDQTFADETCLAEAHQVLALR